MGYFSCNSKSSISICNPYKSSTQIKTIHVRNFSYSDLQTATNGFSSDNFLGKGSHGSVYRAVLDDGKLIAAVKRPPASENTHVENEIEILACVRSPRIVNLVGFGIDSKERKLIVVELMPNGTLFDSLHITSKPPGWNRRVRFAVQDSRAILHLHSLDPPVIHRDIKSSNILIDSESNARLGDFGLALRGHIEDVHLKCTPPAGTLGYLDPSYLAPGDLTSKSDVFSFGILLLEIITGRNAIDMNFSPPSVINWAIPLIRIGHYDAICDRRIGPPEDPFVSSELAIIASRCVLPEAVKRPEIAEVVEWLKAVKRRIVTWRRHVNCGGIIRSGSSQIKYEPLDDKLLRSGRSRWSRKASNVVPATEETVGGGNDRMVRSRSVGSVWEMMKEDRRLDRCLERVGFGVKTSTVVRLRKAKSMAAISCGDGNLEMSKLLGNVEKMGINRNNNK
ncbi:serine/threonine-protein kinase-like protein At3g51990 [Impatiens glandulifera]|uniref:serine/threonine-protein kinase-like protein At3g51990 n=1 Tax=Impatiens glandulifera TaxID=253017 RepID=UPI001FB1233C|nr:serine/threonine-protein kinase-like protein At3g51990 [Impatiens glandulifera]